MIRAIVLLCLFCISLFSTEHVYLTTPDISQENIIGTNAGIRPFRKTGVRIEAEHIQDKLIIHNYGYGGSGLTLCFGGSKEVLSLLSQQIIPVKTVAILGAGAIGLAVAYDLLEHGYEVHLYSDNWSPNLTSNVAAGIWTPLKFPRDLPEQKQHFHQRLLDASKERFFKSIDSSSPEFAGIKLIPYYFFFKQEKPEPDKKEDKVVVHFDNGLVKNGKRYYEIGIEGKVFIENLFEKVKDKGAHLHQIHFETIEDILKLNEPIIINCTSFGSVKLFQDTDFILARGQIIYLKPQEGIDYFIFDEVPNQSDASSYYFFSLYPWNDRLILNGVYEFGEEEAITTPAVIDRLLQNAKNCLSNHQS
jgi:hypothetical protein